MAFLLVILSIVVGLLALWALILSLVVGHRWLLYHPARFNSMPAAVWQKQRDAANGITWPLPPPGQGAPTGKVWDGKDVADFNG